jgi:hypothetical protein
MTMTEFKKRRLPVIKNALKIIMILIMLMGITLSIFNCVSIKKQTNGISNGPAVSKDSGSDKSEKPVDKKSGDDSSFRGPGMGVESVGTIIVNSDGTIDCQGAALDC